jgi:hypothetical protein
LFPVHATNWDKIADAAPFYKNQNEPSFSPGECTLHHPALEIALAPGRFFCGSQKSPQNP